MVIYNKSWYVRFYAITIPSIHICDNQWQLENYKRKGNFETKTDSGIYHLPTLVYSKVIKYFYLYYRGGWLYIQLIMTVYRNLQ